MQPEGLTTDRKKSANRKRVAVIVAHPDDEVLWCGGLLLSRPHWSPFVACLCRAGDPDRAPRFRRVIERLGAAGAMGDLDDGPTQEPVSAATLKALILSLLPEREYDLLVTHSPQGEYTRHRRHEETAEAVWSLWKDGRLKAKALWGFAYEDGGGAYLPRAEPDASLVLDLPASIWATKRELMREVYNYPEDSWEVRTTPRSEAFHRFEAPRAARREQLEDNGHP